MDDFVGAGGGYHRVAHFRPPSIKLIEDFAKPLQFYFRPKFFGMEKVSNDSSSNKPAMFVSNHTVYGLTDGLLFGLELYKQKGIFLRPLVDNLHFEIPVWKDWIPKVGFVRARKENCHALMLARENILVFPGGGRESFKRKGEAYKLIWKNHLGFARMAIQHDYDIIPVAQVGGDDAYKIITDADEIMKSWIGRFLKKSKFVNKYLKGGEQLPPIATGLFGITPFPKPVKLYISFGERIDTSRFRHKFDDEDTLWQLRNEVELAMDKQLIALLEYRKHDKKNIFQRLFS